MYPTCGAQLDGGTEKVEIMPTCMNSHDFLSSFPSCKPVVVVLDKQMLMFGLLHVGCIVTVRIPVGRGNCLLQKKAVKWCRPALIPIL